MDLTERDRVRVEEIVRDVRESDERVRAVMTGNNSVSNKRHKVDRAVDDQVLAQVHHSIELYQKLKDPQVLRMIKAQLFDDLMRQSATTL